jgi:hypothetical protein
MGMTRHVVADAHVTVFHNYVLPYIPHLKRPFLSMGGAVGMLETDD